MEKYSFRKKKDIKKSKNLYFCKQKRENAEYI